MGLLEAVFAGKFIVSPTFMVVPRIIDDVGKDNEYDKSKEMHSENVSEWTVYDPKPYQKISGDRGGRHRRIVRARVRTRHRGDSIRTIELRQIK